MVIVVMLPSNLRTPSSHFNSFWKTVWWGRQSVMIYYGKNYLMLEDIILQFAISNERKNQVETLDPSSSWRLSNPWCPALLFLCRLRRRGSLSGLMVRPTTGQKLWCLLCRPIRRTALLFSGMPRARDTFSHPSSVTSPYPSSANTKVTNLAKTQEWHILFMH